MKLVLATSNPGKVAELAAVLAAVEGLDLLPRPLGLSEPVEDGTSLFENARIKARAAVAASGAAAVADDTGLEVEALGGEPGLYTARYAGPGATFDDNITKLLGALEGITQRRARWRTVALVVLPDGREISAQGTCEGVITDRPRGAGGFGYDPVFVPREGDGRTFAELSREEKNALSHRGRAFRALAAGLTAVME